VAIPHHEREAQGGIVRVGAENDDSDDSTYCHVRPLR
jgi:hypothetical protein